MSFQWHYREAFCISTYRIFDYQYCYRRLLLVPVSANVTLRAKALRWYYPTQTQPLNFNMLRSATMLRLQNLDQGQHYHVVLARPVAPFSDICSPCFTFYGPKKHLKWWVKNLSCWVPFWATIEPILLAKRLKYLTTLQIQVYVHVG